MRTKKLSLITILSVVMLVFVTIFAINAKKASAETTVIKQTDYAKTLVVNGGTSMVNSKGAYQIQAFNQDPHTFESLVFAHSGNNWNGTGNKGSILGGNFVGDEFVNVDVLNNKIVFTWKNEIIWQTNQAVVTNLRWTHIVVVRDTFTSTIRCYVDDVEYLGTYTKGSGIGSDFTQFNVNHWVGRDGTPWLDGTWQKRNNFFNGDINYVGVSAEVKTPQNVAVAYNTNKRLITENTSTTIYSAELGARTYYRAHSAITGVPNTFTATINLPTWATNTHEKDANNIGQVFSTYNKELSNNDISMIITPNGNVRMVWDPDDYQGASYANLVFDTPVSGYSGSLDVRTGEKIHISVVRNKQAGTFDLYLNGVHASTSAYSEAIKTDLLPTYQFAIGKDLNSCDSNQSNHLPFPGKIYDVAMYSTSMNSSQIFAEYYTSNKTTINKTNNSNILANWVLDETQQNLIYNNNHAGEVQDYSGFNNHAYLCTVGAYFMPESDDWFVAGEDEYTLIYIPDTQSTVTSVPEYIESMFDWMVANKNAMNLQFVMGLGDIANGVKCLEPVHYTEQWDIMRANYQKLTDAGVYWSSITGNHDYDHDGNIAPNGVREAGLYNEHFGYNTLTDAEKKTIVAQYHSDTIASAENDMLNVIYEYTAKTVSGTEVKYLVVALEFGPSAECIAWAQDIISQPKYANHRVLFNTHSLIQSEGIYATKGASGYWAGLTNNTALDGHQLWSNFIAKNSNMFLCASGHVSSETVMRREDKTEYGNNVMSMLCDAQGTTFFTNMDAISGWGDPLILVAKVNEKTKKISYRYYNTANNSFFNIENQFEYDFSNWDASTYYNVESSTDIEIDNTNVKCNSIVEFSVNKTDNFVYLEPVVTSNGQQITLTKTGDVYSFVMPKDMVTISVEKLDLSAITLPTSITIKVGETVDLSSYLPTSQEVQFKLNNTNVSLSGTELIGLKEGKSLLTITFTKYNLVKTCGIAIEKATTSSSSSSSSVKPSSSASSSSKVESSSSSSKVEEPSSSSSSVAESSSSSSSSSQQVTSSSQPEQSSSSRAERSAGCGANFAGTGLFIVLALLSVGILSLKKKS